MGITAGGEAGSVGSDQVGVGAGKLVVAPIGERDASRRHSVATRNMTTVVTSGKLNRRLYQLVSRDAFIDTTGE